MRILKYRIVNCFLRRTKAKHNKLFDIYYEEDFDDKRSGRYPTKGSMVMQMTDTPSNKYVVCYFLLDDAHKVTGMIRWSIKLFLLFGLRALP